MSLKRIFILLIILLLCLNLYAKVELKKENKYKIETGIYEDDYFFIGKELKFTGKTDDLYFIGERLTFTGETKTSLNAIGDKLTINGIVGNNITVAGKDIEINGVINGSVFIAGKNAIIKNSAVINGTVFSTCHNLKIDGNINGELFTGCGILTLNGKITGNVNAGAGKIYIDDTGKINGNFYYSSDRKLNDDEKSKITGNIKFEKLDRRWKRFKSWHSLSNTKVSKNRFILFFIIFRVIIIISFLILGSLILIFPVMKKLEDERTDKNFWFTTLWGLIPFFLYPAAAIISFIMPPLALTLFFAGLPILITTQIIGITLLGNYFFKKFNWHNKSRHLFFLFGSILYTLVIFIPLINIAASIFFSSIGWGLILEGLFKRKLA